MLTYLSLASGIAADSVAWGSLGWRCVGYAEIEPFPCAVLNHHYGCGAPEIMPSPLCAKTPKEAKRLEAQSRANAKLPPRKADCPPNLGDIRSIDARRFEGVNVLMGGTPCQDFSVAGRRAGLKGDRGNLALEYVRIANECNPDAAVWENVPGVLSDTRNAFGRFLSALAGCDFPAEPGPRPPLGKSGQFWRWSAGRGHHVPRWPDAGWVDGPGRTVAWRVLDAQYFGLAQRRRRVFVVGCPCDGADPREILFERGGMRRDTPPRREAQTDVAGAFTSCAYSGGSGGRPEGAAGGHFLPDLAGTLKASFRIRTDAEAAASGYYIPDISGSLTARFGRNGGASNDDLTGHRLITQALTGRLGSGGPDDNKAQGGFYVAEVPPVAHCLNARGMKRQHHETETLIATTLRAEGHDASEDGTGRQNLVVTPLQEVGKRTGKSTDDSRAGIGIGAEGAPMFTLQGGAQHAVSVSLRGRDGGGTAELSGEVATALRSSQGGSDKAHILQRSTVRRLMPVETERLQGFPDDYTAIPGASDSARYKAIGNSIARPCLHWIGKRIDRALLRLWVSGKKATA